MAASKLKQQFDKAAEDVKTLKERPDNQALLDLYANYKQATEGDVSGERPGAFSMVARAKYDAWAGLKGTKPDDAMKAYVKLVDGLLKK